MQINFFPDKVTAYKQLNGGIEFVDAIPKSASGKILRRKLRESSKLSSHIWNLCVVGEVGLGVGVLRSSNI